jgi:hypothetical protein
LFRGVLVQPKSRANNAVATAQVTNITGGPERSQIRSVMGVRVLVLWATVITLAVAPMGVPFPPKPAPSANVQYSATVFFLEASYFDRL